MNQNSAIITPEQMAIEDVKRLANIVLGLRDQVFKKDLDYGVIPGTGNKPTLLLPGMEKLMRALHLRAEYVEKSKVEDFDSGRIYYRYECRLIDYATGECISTAIGSANSMESKWRWREQSRKCPNCGKETIIKGKQEYGGGWLCFAKKGGCGAKFADNDPAIVSQPTGRVENPDIFDQMNTIDKIAQKRALGSAIKGAANVSEFFTVDLEDFAQYDTSNVVEGSYTVVKQHNGHEPDSVPAAAPSAKVVGVQPRPTPPPASVAEPPAPSGASVDPDPLAEFGMEQGATVMPIATDPREAVSDDDPNVRHVDHVIISRSKGATQVAFAIVNSHNRIPVIGEANISKLTDLFVGDTHIMALTIGTHELVPTWKVYADHDKDGWHISKIETGIPVNGVSE